MIWKCILNMMIMHWELGENPLGTSKSKPPSPPPKEKHIGPLDVAYRLVSLGCKEFVFITMFVTHFLPTWNLPTKVKIPIYLHATLFGTLVGLGFKALELQNPKKITSWITGSYQLVNLDASMLSCFHVTGLHACCSQGSEHKVRRSITHLMTLLPWELLNCKCDHESVFLVEFLFSPPPTKHYLTVH
jgi:hypothetical protein